MDLTQLKQALADLLQGAPGLGEAEVLPAFPAGKHLPLTGPAIILGVDGMELSPAGLGGFSPKEAGSLAAITVRFDLFSPGKDGPNLHLLHEALCRSLMEKGESFGLAKIWCDPLAWDDSAGSYRLSARALLRGRARSGSVREAQGGIFDFRLSWGG